MSLSLYNKKRNFKKTAEPKGLKARVSSKLYLIQKHAASHLHYDLRLELNGVLLSWAVPKGPCFDPKVKRLAMQVEDHPVAYGSFEGMIPKGEYGGGTVMLWDTGTWSCEDKSAAKAYAEGHLHFKVKGKKLKGTWNLIRAHQADDKTWFLIKGKDAYAQALADFDVTAEQPNSVKTKRSLEEITKGEAKAEPGAETTLAKSAFPEKISPQLATLVSQAPQGDQWLHETKLDGYRMLAFKEGQSVRLMSRNHQDWSAYFPKVVAKIKSLKIKNAIFDGEIVILDKAGNSDFGALQKALEAKAQSPFIYYLFDLLYYDAYDLRPLALEQRKELLHTLIPGSSGLLRYSQHSKSNGDLLFKKACKLGQEGIISKDATAPYEERRTQTWVKTKCSLRQEFVIGGFTKPAGARNHFGSLFLGYFDDQKQLIFCGNVGTGFDAESLKNIYTLLHKHEQDQNPFTSLPPRSRSAHWVKPVIACEVEFSQWTPDGHLRHPTFRGLRIDKSPKQIKQDKTTTIITHPERIVYPEDKITKAEIAEYYDAIADYILAYISNRALTLLRCPEVYSESFYQKHLPKSKNIFVKDELFYIKDRAGLLELIQKGAIEIHPWGSSIKRLEYPDMITFDLDPSPEVKWKRVVEAAYLIKTELENYGLKSFVKTTGGKGLHIVVPIKPEYKWPEVKNFAHVFVKYLAATYPDSYVSEASKLKRKGKIFLDYLRNQRGATAVAAYSLRARTHAPVSMPIAWTELTDNFNDTNFNIESALQRLKQQKKDPWQDFFSFNQTLNLSR